MLQKYLFIPVIASILGGLVIWSHHLGPKIVNTPLSQNVPAVKKLIEPHRALSSVQTVISPQKLEIEPVESN